MSQYLAVKMALLAFVASHLTELEDRCPDVVPRPMQRRDPGVQPLMQSMVTEVQARDEGEGAQVIFYGDSITETWRGTDQGLIETCRRCGLAPDLFQRSFGKYTSLILGIGSDQVGNLHWRMLNGNIPLVHRPAVAVINVGINDILIGNGCYDTGILGNITAFKIMELVESLADLLPQTQILLVSILPAGDRDHPETLFKWPNALTPGIEAANYWLSRAFAEKERVTLLDCTQKFIPFGWIEPFLQGDGLHPEHYGLKVLADCISPVLDQLMSHQHHLDKVRLHTERHLHQSSHRHEGSNHTRS